MSFEHKERDSPWLRLHSSKVENVHDLSSFDMSAPISPLPYCHYCDVHRNDYFELHCGSCKSVGHEESNCPLLGVLAKRIEDIFE